VKLLLDTHTLLWYVLDDPQLSAAAQAAIMEPANEVYASPASYWELAIKISIGKLTVQQPFEDFLDACESRYRFQLLPITARHTVQVSTLPFPQNHRDPFDRLIVAQALVEQMTVVSGDVQLDAYGVSRLW
jgi:PIN domain nuclease of toxin-antitoxin system